MAETEPGAAAVPPNPHMLTEEPPELSADDLKLLDAANDAVGAEMAAEDPDLDARADAMADILGGLTGDAAHAAAALTVDRPPGAS